MKKVILLFVYLIAICACFNLYFFFVYSLDPELRSLEYSDKWSVYFEKYLLAIAIYSNPWNYFFSILLFLPISLFYWIEKIQDLKMEIKEKKEKIKDMAAEAIKNFDETEALVAKAYSDEVNSLQRSFILKNIKMKEIEFKTAHACLQRRKETVEKLEHELNKYLLKNLFKKRFLFLLD